MKIGWKYDVKIRWKYDVKIGWKYDVKIGWKYVQGRNIRMEHSLLRDPAPHRAPGQAPPQAGWLHPLFAWVRLDKCIGPR